MPFTIIASAVDPGNQARTALGGQENEHVPVWRIGTDLYVMVVVQIAPGASNSQIAIYKSTDEGSTWTMMDSSNQPGNSWAANNWLEGTTIYALVGPQIDESSEPLRLYSFDCTSDTWSLIDAAGPNAYWPSFLARLSTGDFVLAYGTTPFSNDLWLASYSGGTWTNIQDLTLVTSAAINAAQVYGDRDQDDWTHIVFHNTTTTDFWHASVDDSLALGTVDALPALDLSNGVLCLGNYILVACKDSAELKVLSGTPLNAPSFTLSSTIDALEPDLPAIAYDSLTSRLIVCYGDFDTESQFWMSYTSDLTGLSGWASPVLLYDTDVDTLPADSDSPPIFCWPSQVWAEEGKFWLCANYPSSTAGTEVSFIIGRWTFDVLFRNRFQKRR